MTVRHEIAYGIIVLALLAVGLLISRIARRQRRHGGRGSRIDLFEDREG
jgi:MFS superfamily sulfate permease-like transporter